MTAEVDTASSDWQHVQRKDKGRARGQSVSEKAAVPSKTIGTFCLNVFLLNV